MKFEDLNKEKLKSSMLQAILDLIEGVEGQDWWCLRSTVEYMLEQEQTKNDYMYGKRLKSGKWADFHIKGEDQICSVDILDEDRKLIDSLTGYTKSEMREIATMMAEQLAYE